MSLHWTYEAISSKEDDLRQGDIIILEDGLRVLLEAESLTLPSPSPLGFLVVSQCCDLARRSGAKCNTSHIALAPVYDLEARLEEFLDKVCERILPRIYTYKSKLEAKFLVERILNQNETSLSLFYLHRDAKCGIPDYWVAILREIYTIPAASYASLVTFRQGRLSAQFRNKLGYMVGNLYSRVGTTDWSETSARKAEFNELQKRFLNVGEPLWVRPDTERDARQKFGELSSLSQQELRKKLTECEKSLGKRIAEIAKTLIEDILDRFCSKVAKDVSNSLCSQLASNAEDKNRKKKELQDFLKERLPAAFQSMLVALSESVEKDLKHEFAECANLPEGFSARALQDAAINQFESIPSSLFNRMLNDSIVARIESLVQDDS